MASPHIALLFTTFPKTSETFLQRDVAALQAKGLTSPLLAGAMAALPASIPADVWIGKDGLVRRVHLALGVAQGRMAMTMDLSDYGTDVAIAAPPSSDVFDATQLAQQGMSGYSG